MSRPLHEWHDALTAAAPGLGPVAVYAETPSTQDVCRERVRALGPAAAGFVCVAERQNAGRGRLGRCWVAPPGRTLTFSLCAPPALSAGLLGLAAPVALVRALDGFGLAAAIKWPNDLYAGGRKLAGILIEVADGVPVVGIGLNTLAEPADFPPELQGKATSLRLLGVEADPLEVLAACLAALTAAFAEAARDPAPLQREWKLRCGAFGKTQAWLHDGRRVEGEAVDVDPEAGLLVRTCDGLLVRLPAATTASAE